VVLCQLVLPGGRAAGLFWFIVPLRDPSSGETLPGVTIGDCGLKYGRNGVDNGHVPRFPSHRYCAQ
jgi:acyl-CoA oxidase